MTNTVLSFMIGKTPASVEEVNNNYQSEIHFKFSDGTSVVFTHEQDCCEDVKIEDINGDLSDLVGVPLLVAEERMSYGDGEYYHYTWTFYTFRSIKGSVDIRWIGSSNGYYSEWVDILYYSEEGELV